MSKNLELSDLTESDRSLIESLSKRAKPFMSDDHYHTVYAMVWEAVSNRYFYANDRVGWMRCKRSDA